MPIKIDGTNGVLQAYDFQVLTTGFSYTFAAGTQTLIANPAGTLATGTITMPAAPADGMVITIESTQQVTAVTVQGNSGQTLTGAPSQLIPNQPLSFIYRQSNTTWYAMAGGAGRATALVSGTAVASTSGTSIDFTSIPSWVKRITVMMNGTSLSGTSNYLVQIGSGSVTTSGYVSSCNNGSGTVTTSTSGFLSSVSSAAADLAYGSIVLTTLGSNIWTQTSMLNNGATIRFGAGAVTLGGTLDRIRITTVGGTDTFDAGTINILYE
jgi:hypothetical protein